MADTVRMVLTGESWPISKDNKSNVNVLVKRSEPLVKYTKMMSSKLGRSSFDGLTLCKAKGTMEKGYTAGEPVNMQDPVPVAADKKNFIGYVAEGAVSPPSSAAKPAAKKASPKRSAPPNPTGGSKKPAAKLSASSPPSSPKSPKSAKLAPKPAGKATATPKSPKPASKKSAASPRLSPETDDQPGDSPATNPVSPIAPLAPPPPSGMSQGSLAYAPNSYAPNSFPPLNNTSHNTVPPGYNSPIGFGYPPSSPFLAASQRNPYQSSPLNPKQEEYKRRLTEYYMRHNPAKVAEVPAILERFAGEEDLLFLKLKSRYESPESPASLRTAALGSPIPRITTHSPTRTGASASPERIIDGRIVEMSREQEARLRFEEEKLQGELRVKLDEALRNLQEMRRKDALEREERETRERRDREEREARQKRDVERQATEMRALENLVRDREHAQRMREDDMERRDRDLRRRQDELAIERELLRRRELEAVELAEREEDESRARAEHMLALLNNHQQPSSPMPVSAAAGAGGAAAPYQHQPATPPLATNPRTHSPAHDLAPHTPPSQLRADGGGGGGGAGEAAAAEFAPLADLLSGAGLSKYAPIFAANDFNVDSFRSLTDSDLTGLSITAVGARKRILAEIDKLKLAQSVSDSVEALGSSNYNSNNNNNDRGRSSPPGHAQHQQQQQQQQQQGGGGRFPRPVATPNSYPYTPRQEASAGREVDPSAQRLRAIESKIDGLHDLVEHTAGEQHAAAYRQHQPFPQNQPPVDYYSDALTATKIRNLPHDTADWHRELLYKFYQAHDPVKTQQVDRILAEYADRLHTLYTMLAGIYDVEPSPYTGAVRRALASHHPGREEAAEILCKLCRGREAELLEDLHSKTTRGDIGGVEAWSELVDPASGRVYYYSRVAGEAQWSKPSILARRDQLLEREVSAFVHPPAAGDAVPFSSHPPADNLAANPVPAESISYLPNTRSASRNRRLHHRAWLHAFLLKHDPARVNDVDEIMERFAGHEDAMVETIRKQYNTAG
ncbi:hypothetical protein DIPPA_32158 [Diplonema papillatum]|nr:hypothetical protein DIPPA_32158 [Diplonema papillatum]